MSNACLQSHFSSRWPILLLGLTGTCFAASTAPPTVLSDAPIGTSIIVPANVILDLSVEYPTADDAPYLGAYDPVNGPNTLLGTSYVNYYAGYFNPNFCYTYNTTNNYFVPAAASGSNHSCTGQWSGNFLNWALTQTIDPMRQALTGGFRSVDTASVTVLQKAYSDAFVGSDGFPDKTITGALVSSSTPFSWASLTISNRNTGLTFYFSSVSPTNGGNSLSGTSLATYPGDSAAAASSSVGPVTLISNPTCYTASVPCIELQTSTTTTTTGSAVQTVTTTTTTCTTRQAILGGYKCTKVTGPTASSTTSTIAYQLYAAGQVCTSSELTGANSDMESSGGRCRGYPYGSASPTVYKPIGLMQKYAAENSTGTDSIRYSVFGYLLDPSGSTANQQLDGGVMRAKMKSVGPYQANPGQAVNANAASEWSASTGVFNTNPNPSDATATPTVTGPTPANSGVMPYLNLFGTSHTPTGGGVLAYKVYDPVGELYYMALRYYRNLGNLASHTTTASAITSGEATNDNFPVITTWDDPIAYSCSTNYVIGIGDIHTWNDANVPATAAKGSYEVASYAPADDSGVSATDATNYIANIENLAGDTGGTSGRSSYYTEATGLGNALIGGIASPSGGWGASQNSFYMAGLAFDAHVRDIRPDITVKSAPVTVSTFWLDVYESADYHQKNQFWLTAKYGGFNTSLSTFGSSGYPIAVNTSGATPGSSAAALSYSTSAFPTATLATTPLPLAAWNTGGYVDNHNNYAPDQYFQAENPSKLRSALNTAFAKIVASVPAGTSTALSLGSSSVSVSGNVNYVASYSSDWSGDVSAQTITLTQTGAQISSTATPVWDAHNWLPPTTAATATGGVTPLTASTRIIASSTAKGAGHGTPFTMAGLLPAQSNTLVSPTWASATPTQVLNYIRGDQSLEGANQFRTRSSVLGDITNSRLAIYGAPSLPYADSPLNPGYTSFESTNSSRGTVVYVGANDGMLHAFDGTPTATGGKELFAYVPSSLLTTNTDSNGNAVGLGSIAASPLQHHFMVDAAPLVIDVDFARTNGTIASFNSSLPTPDWHTIVISGLGKGGGSSGSVVGGGYFALDVTNPSAIASDVTAATLSSKVLWETDPTVLADMGYSFGTPLVIKTAKYGWTVVLTSGYDNTSNHGHIYLVNPKNGTLYETITTPDAGTSAKPAGLANVTAYINNYSDYTADALYAGDLLGNVWRVDLTQTTGALTAKQFARLVDSSGAVQPITTRPVTATDPTTSARYVFVGTGRLLSDSDLVNPQTDTFYGFVDGTNTAFNSSSTYLPILRTDLASDYTATNASGSTGTVNGVTLTSSQKGFYIDLASAATSGSGTQASAERINVQPVASGGVVAFAANLYGQNVCIKGGSRLFTLSYATSYDSSGNAIIGGTLLQSSTAPSTPVPYLSYATGLITSLSLVNSSPGSGSSSLSSGLMVMAGLDTSSAGAGATAKSSVVGDVLGKGSASFQRLNWREVPSAQ